jgi:serine protease
MNKLYFSFVVFLLALTMNAQSAGSSEYYYYYKNQKVYLTVDKSKVNIITSANFQKNSISNLGFQDFNLETINGSTAKKIGKLESTATLTDAQFNQKLNSLRQKPNIKNIGLYFKTGETTESIGTSNIFYVKLNNASDHTLLQQTATQKGVQIERQIPNMPQWYVISVDNASVGTALKMSNEFYETGLFADVDPAFMFDFYSDSAIENEDQETGNTPPPSTTSPTPCATDPVFALNWNINNTLYNNGIDVRACGAWEVSRGDGIKIALIDSGVQKNHPDLEDNIFTANSYDCLTQTSPSVIWSKHGTEVAGKAAAVRNNGYPIVGVAPEAKLMVVSHNLQSVPGIAAELADGIAWAWQNGADVINCSWGAVVGDYGDPGGLNLVSAVLEEAIIEAMTLGRDGKGSVVVFAAGNTRRITYPAKFHEDILTVGAIRSSGEQAYMEGYYITYPNDPKTYYYYQSAYGDELDVVAPGQGLWATQYNFTNNTGMVYVPSVSTSLAAPHVSGLAALLLAANPCLTRQQVCDIIEQTAQKKRTDLYTYTNTSNRPHGTWNNRMGYGLIDANAAVQMAVQTRGSLDLMIKDSNEDIGEEPNLTSPYTWASPSIWVRNQPDNIEQHQNPIYYLGDPNYVYVRVTNNSCVPFKGGGLLKVYWAKTLTNPIWEADWNGENTLGINGVGPVTGNQIGEMEIPPILPGEDAVLMFEWPVPAPTWYVAMSGGNAWQYSLLARIESEEDIMTFDEVQNTTQNVRNNNNIAQKNVTVVNKYPSKNLGGVIAINSFDIRNALRVDFVSDDKESGRKIFEEAEVWVVLDDVMMNAWLAGGQQTTNIVQRSENLFMITGDGASFDNLNFQTNEIGTLYLHFNFLTQEVTEKSLYTYHVVQRDGSTGEILGGAAYQINKDPRDLFYADGGGDKEVDKNETIVLSAETIGEPAIYNWYDSEGNLIFEGVEFEVSVEVAKKYRLEIIALSDGFKDYVEVEIDLKPNALKQVSPNPATVSTSVVYKINKGESAYLSVTGFYGAGNGISNNYILNIDQTELTLDLSGYPSGMYAVALIVNGQISDTTTLIKQ